VFKIIVILNLNQASFINHIFSHVKIPLTMKKLLTGIRPTGALHLGHYIGALKQWVELQNDYECYFMVADIQALTTHADNPSLIKESVQEVVLDFLAVGLDPEKSNVHFILQSAIPELTELTVYLSMVTPFSRMQTNPTVQSELKNIKNVTTGFMCYPISQAADILFISPRPTEKAEKILVPVGEDQLPHLRDTNDIAKMFNRTYEDTFSYCEPLLGEVGRLVGTDGEAKMSKSLNNAIFLKDTKQEVEQKVKKMFTDPKRIHPTDPGTVEGNPVFVYHDAFNKNKKEVEDLKTRYRKGTVGDVEVKEKLTIALEEFLHPIRKKRKESEDIDSMKYLSSGTKEARKVAQETLDRAREAMHLDYGGI
jgi:tryptophanyl-tRNA synthetase